MDISGSGTRDWRLRTPAAPVTWAVTDEDPGPGWISQETAHVTPVPAQVTWVYHQWRVQQEIEADWKGAKVTRPVQVWVTARDVPDAGRKNIMIVHGKVSKAQAEWLGYVTGTP